MPIHSRGWITAREPRTFVLLDRDGTLIREKHYLSRPEDVELLPGAAEALRMLQDIGCGLVVVTNQSGIGRGIFDEAQMAAVHDRLRGCLEVHGVELDGIYHCPHVPSDGCECRKPLPGMVRRASADLGFEPHRAWVIGDKPCDIELGKRLGARSILVRTGHGAFFEGSAVEADAIVDDLAAAARLIVRGPVGSLRPGPRAGRA